MKNKITFSLKPTATTGVHALKCSCRTVIHLVLVQLTFEVKSLPTSLAHISKFFVIVHVEAESSRCVEHFVAFPAQEWLVCVHVVFVTFLTCFKTHRALDTFKFQFLISFSGFFLIPYSFSSSLPLGGEVGGVFAIGLLFSGTGTFTLFKGDLVGFVVVSSIIVLLLSSAKVSLSRLRTASCTSFSDSLIGTGTASCATPSPVPPSA